MITRGSQGDVFPYLPMVRELKRRGHNVTINLPTAFEENAKKLGVKYYLQTEDDIRGMMEDKVSQTDAVKWIGRVVDHQCKWLPEVLRDYDVLVATNSEMAAPMLAEYVGIPMVRTCCAPIIPSRIIPPPLIPLPKPNPILTPRILWWLTRAMAVPFLKEPMNANLQRFGLKPIRNTDDFRVYTSVSHHNALCYSSLLSEPDPQWTKDGLSFVNTGYCFNSDEPYDEVEFQKAMDYIHGDNRPTVFFTLGSCEYPRSEQFFDILLKTVRELNYKLLVGAGWSKCLNEINAQDRVYVMKGFIPHGKVLPECALMLHHAGSGTTHQAVLSGIPQLQLPLNVDQHFWSYRCLVNGLSPHWLNEKKPDQKELMEKMIDAVANPKYKKNVVKMQAEMKKENGVKAVCDYIESMKKRG